MQHQETKYLVDSFLPFIDFFAAHNINPQEPKTTHHYYGRQPGPGVTKLVDYGDHQEIHILSEKDGQFKLSSALPIASVELGLEWLRQHGFTSIDHIQMTATDYAYKQGRVRLYLLNNEVHSIILDYPVGQELEVAVELGLTEQQLLRVPYNVYLQNIL